MAKSQDINIQRTVVVNLPSPRGQLSPGPEEKLILE